MFYILDLCCAQGPLPAGLGRPLLEGALKLGRSMAATSFGPLEEWRHAKLKQIFDSGKKFEI